MDIFDHIAEYFPDLAEELSKSQGMKRLLKAVTSDLEDRKNYSLLPNGDKYYYHDHLGKLNWIINRARCYSAITGLAVNDIIDSWEEDRDYWYMNYYQDSNQPILPDQLYLFQTMQEMRDALGTEFECPNCGKTITSPIECPCCEWKSYGLFGTIGKGMYVFCIEKLKGQQIFRSKNFFENYKEQPNGNPE